MQKRIVALLLAVCLVCGLVPVAGLAAEQTVYEGMCGENAYYELNTETGVLRIYGSGSITDYGSAPPWGGFQGSIKSVVVEEGITSVGSYGFFRLSEVTSAKLPSTLTSIGYRAFEGCTKMTVCDIPAGVTAIYSRAFGYCRALQGTVLPKGLTTLEDNAFFQCAALTSVEIPSTLKTIGNYAFAGCSALQDLVISEGVENIGTRAFIGIAARRVVIPASAKTIGDWAFRDCPNLEYAVFMPGCGIAYLRQGVFNGDPALKRVRLPDGLEEIGVYAFSGCESLTRLDLPSTMKKVSLCTNNCPSLTVITVASTDMSFSTEGYGFGTPNQTTLYGYNPSTTREFAVQNGHMFRELGTEPEDDWDPFKEPDPPKLPSDVSVSVSGDYVVGGSIQITASAKDAETITVIVEHNGKEVLSKDVGPVSYVFPETGTYEVYARATNKDGSVESERQMLIVRTPEPTNSPSPAPGNPTPEPADRFQDVSKTHYARKAINWAVANKVAGGMSSNVFGVGKNCDRSQAVFFIWAAEGRPEPSLTKNPFVDVSSGAYYYKAVLWAKENGVTAGKDATHFNPKGDVTRGQIMTFLYAAKGKPAVESSGRFTDVKPSDYYSRSVAWAAQNGISSGKGGSTTFKPKDNCKREEIVTFLYQAYK